MSSRLTQSEAPSSTRPGGADQCQRLGRIEPAVVERTPRDRALQFLRARLEQELHVLDRGEAARGDDRKRDRVGERDGRVEIEALEQAVAGDVGVDDRRDADVLEAPGEVERGELGGLGPALHRDFSVARIEADRDALWKLARRLPDECGIAHRRGADDDAVDPLAEPGLDSRHVADAAAQLHAQADRLENAVDRRGVHRPAREGSVEIDDVEMAKTFGLERMRLRGGIAVEHGRAPHVALFEAHAYALFEVDGGEEDHGQVLTPRYGVVDWSFGGRSASSLRRARNDRWGRLRCPLQEVRDQRKSHALAFLRVKLRAHYGVARDDRGDRPAIVGLGDKVGAVSRLEL